MKHTISVAVVAHNEEKHLDQCLKSAVWADEIVVLDADSSDNTGKIARRYTKKVFRVKNQPLMKINNNLSFEKCTSDWILCLDADEIITADLKTEIESTLSENTDISAYRLPRKNIIFGKWFTNSGWYPDYQLRLFRRGKGKFPARNVHEELEVDGNIGNLEKAMEHINYESLDQFIVKLNKYTTIEAEKLINEKRTISWQDAITYPFSQFLTWFFARKGYTEGLHGLVWSLLQAFYWEVVFAKVWEHEGFWQYDSKNFLAEVAKQGWQVAYGWNHWLMVEEKNPLRKIYRKTRNKLSRTFSQ